MNPFQSSFVSTSSQFPEYHSGMLEVKFQALPGTAPVGAGFMGATASPIPLARSAAATQAGLGMLLAFERSGMIRRVTSLARIAAGAGAAFAMNTAETPVLSTLAASVLGAEPDDSNAGVSIIELFQDSDVGLLEKELRKDPTVQSVSRVPVRYLLAKKKAASPGTGVSPTATPPAASQMWNLNKIRWPQARNLPGFQDATNIKVGVLDTGIDDSHHDLAGIIENYEYAHPSSSTASSKQDIIGHGTHVAGTIAARINNNIGINGVCHCKLSAFKIFDDQVDGFNGQTFGYYVNPVMYAQALSRCLTLGMNVINLSIGGQGAPSAQEKALFAALISAGTVVVASMGNSGNSAVHYPAAIDDVIAVGATKVDDSRAGFSTIGRHIALSAPGVGIWSTLPTYAGNQGYWPKSTFPFDADFTNPIVRETNYDAWQGTSMASPHVAAAAALLLAKSPNLTPAQVKAKLQSTAVKVPGMGTSLFTNEYGAGRLDLLNLLS